MKQCQFCLVEHSEDEYCKCFLCKCEMSYHFIRCAHVDGKPVALCPTCDDKLDAPNPAQN